jgi:hypothetical protein
MGIHLFLLGFLFLEKLSFQSVRDLNLFSANTRARNKAILEGSNAFNKRRESSDYLRRTNAKKFADRHVPILIFVCGHVKSLSIG